MASIERDELETAYGVVLNEKAAVMAVQPTFLQLHGPCAVDYRTKAVDWMIEICADLCFVRETTHMAVVYFDTYLSLMTEPIERNEVQLLACACLSIAAKMEEVDVVGLETYADATDNTYTCDEITDQELKLLTLLDWEMTITTLQTWVAYYLQMDGRRLRTRYFETQVSFMQPVYKMRAFEAVAPLLDVVLLDSGHYMYSQPLLVAACLHMQCSMYMDVEGITGFRRSDPAVVACLAYLNPLEAVSSPKNSPPKKRKRAASVTASDTSFPVHVDVEHMWQCYSPLWIKAIRV